MQLAHWIVRASAVGVLSADMRARVREDAEYFGLAGLITAVDEMNAAAVAGDAAEDEKRVLEAIAAEERAAKQRVFEATVAEERAAKRQCHAHRKFEYKHGCFYIGHIPDGEAGEDRRAEKARHNHWLATYAGIGFRVAKFVVDGSGEYADMMLEKVSGQLEH
jgi:hypothetical protein